MKIQGVCIFLLLSSFFVATRSFGAEAPNEASDISETPIQNSWEAWILKARFAKKPKELPIRPDQRSLTEPLPLWVDCHLSWSFDQPQARTSPALQGVVLRSTPHLCKGQLEEWAQASKTP